MDLRILDLINGLREGLDELTELITSANRKELIEAFKKEEQEEPREYKYDPSKPEGYWKVVVAYYLSDFEGFDLKKLDDQIYDALNHRSVDGGQGSGFGSRDLDAFFDVKRFAEEAVKEVAKIEGAENLSCYMIEVNPCCGVADECICDD